MNAIIWLVSTVAIPYKSGKYSYKWREKNEGIDRIIEVAIPYKSGKYSYDKIKTWAKKLNGNVAIPYKSGKYSY